MRFTPIGKVVVLLLTLGLVAGVWRYWNRIAPPAANKESVVPTKINLPNTVPNTDTVAMQPTGSEANAGCSDKPEVRMLGYAWNAQMGMLLANGGAQAQRGSLMCRNGVNFRWQRQDDNSKLQEGLVSFATELSRGTAQPTKGVHFVTIMGDGGAAFIKGLNDALRRIGPDYQAKIVNAIGYSRGEDKFMGPPEWKADPETSKGGLVAGVLRDGDWNIAQKWLGDNGLRTNPDEKTWDPDALNWVAANDYIDASEKYIAGYSEVRPVVRNGKRTGETKRVTVNGVVTWTPGDVTIAKKKGGLISIISTKEYSSQMPCVVIGIDKWMKQNRATVENMILATAEGGDLIKTSPAALKRGARIVSTLFKEDGAGPEYWEKYFKGTQEVDAKGLTVELGGSSVNNLADSLFAFGLVPGSANLVGVTYTVFGDLVQSQYPEFVPAYYPADDVIDRSYLQGAQRRASLSPTVLARSKPVYKPQTGQRVARNVVSRRAWNITFQPGKATFTPQAYRFMNSLSRDLLVAGGTSIEIHGHTDNQGNNPGRSWTLSKQRAEAVKRWLEQRAPANFPRGRIQAYWHGEENPVARGNNPQAWAKNRRVEIVLRAA
ncbi:MAG TPA: OmpA family protein [Abditibacteriaceae bacterium]|jgi:outer membrane protein OmpA-like peptidoglycan-associated protein